MQPFPRPRPAAACCASKPSTLGLNKQLPTSVRTLIKGVAAHCLVLKPLQRALLYSEVKAQLRRGPGGREIPRCTTAHRWAEWTENSGGRAKNGQASSGLRGGGAGDGAAEGSDGGDRQGGAPSAGRSNGGGEGSEVWPLSTSPPT